MSLVKAICYGGNAAAGRVAAVQWGCDHEEDAKETYIQQASKEHQDLRLLTSGLFINPKFPEVGASPDGIIK